MIRINLLTVERPVVKAKVKAPFELGQKITVICSLIFLVTVVLLGWRYWTLKRESGRLDVELTNADKEVARLKVIIEQVEEFEQRKGVLQDRVNLIERLRKAQTVPVHLLDEVSRALPPMLWLVDMKQLPNSTDVVIEGRCTALTSLSDFIANLEASGYFKRSIEIVSSTTNPLPRPPGELINFSIKATFQRPGDAEPDTPAAGGAGGHS